MRNVRDKLTALIVEAFQPFGQQIEALGKPPQFVVGKDSGASSEIAPREILGRRRQFVDLPGQTTRQIPTDETGRDKSATRDQKDVDPDEEGQRGDCWQLAGEVSAGLSLIAE